MADDRSSKEVAERRPPPPFEVVHVWKLRNHLSSFFPLVTNDPTVATSSVVDFVAASFPPPSPPPRRTGRGGLVVRDLILLEETTI
jgi:hypothetical protein